MRYTAPHTSKLNSKTVPVLTSLASLPFLSCCHQTTATTYTAGNNVVAILFQEIMRGNAAGILSHQRKNS